MAGFLLRQLSCWFFHPEAGLSYAKAAYLALVPKQTIQFFLFAPQTKAGPRRKVPSVILCNLARLVYNYCVMVMLVQ